MSSLRPVGPVAFENSRGQTAPKNRLAKESGNNSALAKFKLVIILLGVQYKVVQYHLGSGKRLINHSQHHERHSILFKTQITRTNNQQDNSSQQLVLQPSHQPKNHHSKILSLQRKAVKLRQLLRFWNMIKKIFQK